MQKTSALSPSYHFTDCFIAFEVKLLLFTLPGYRAKAQKIALYTSIYVSI